MKGKKISRLREIYLYMLRWAYMRRDKTRGRKGVFFVVRYYNWAEPLYMYNKLEAHCGGTHTAGKSLMLRKPMANSD